MSNKWVDRESDLLKLFVKITLTVMKPTYAPVLTVDTAYKKHYSGATFL